MKHSGKQRKVNTKNLQQPKQLQKKTKKNIKAKKLAPKRRQFSTNITTTTTTTTTTSSLPSIADGGNREFLEMLPPGQQARAAMIAQAPLEMKKKLANQFEFQEHPQSSKAYHRMLLEQQGANVQHDTPVSPYDPHDVGTYHSPSAEGGKFMQSSHTLRVKKLYRKLLRDHFNWYGTQYENYVVKAEGLRDEFEKNRNLTDIGEIETIIREAEVFLFETEDPSPYRPLMHPDGGVWGRNQPMARDWLKPPPSTHVLGRDIHVEERTIRHLHANPTDDDFAPTHSSYSKLKILRGEYWFDPSNPATFNEVVADYCESVGIQYSPSPQEVFDAHNKATEKFLSSDQI